MTRPRRPTPAGAKRLRRQTIRTAACIAGFLALLTLYWALLLRALEMTMW